MTVGTTTTRTDSHLRFPWRERVNAAQRRCCAASGCAEEGTHRAPASRERLRDYQWLCLEHVREYNRRWDFFSGMSQSEIDAYRRADVTWHRPTWRLGHGRGADGPGMDDPFGFFSDAGSQARPAPQPTDRTRRMMEILGVRPGFTAAELKRRFTTLVKQHHPDVNGGAKEAEARLRAVIEAYRFLRSQEADPAR